MMKILSNKITLLSVIFVLLLTSCLRKKEIENIVKVPDSQFHGINLGDTPKQVMVAEQGNKLGDKSNGETFISYEFDLEEGENYYVGYSFDDGKLYDIQVDFFLDNKQRAADLFSEFKDFYTLKFGESHIEQGNTVWTSKVNDKQVTVLLQDDSEQYKKESGKLSLTIFNINY